MKRKCRRKVTGWSGLLLLLLTLGTDALALEPPLNRFRQDFDFTSSGVPFTIEARRSLVPLEDGRWRMEVAARHWLGEIREVTEFRWEGCVPRTTYYAYTRTGLGKDRKAEIFLDQADGQVRVEKARREPRAYPMSGKATDKLSQTLALQCMLADERQELEMQVADERGVDHVRYRRLGEEWLDLPSGRIRAVKVEKIRDPDRARRTLFWFAPGRDYELVQMIQHEDDREHKMVIKNLSD